MTQSEFYCFIYYL